MFKVNTLIKNKKTTLLKMLVSKSQKTVCIQGKQEIGLHKNTKKNTNDQICHYQVEENKR